MTESPAVARPWRRSLRDGTEHGMSEGFLRVLIVFAALISSTLATAVAGQEGTRDDVLPLDRAMELARANNRETKGARLEIDRRGEASAEARTAYFPRLDTYLLGTELLRPLDFTIRAGQLGTFPSTGPIPSSNVGLHTPARPIAIASFTVTQPITQLLRTRLSVGQQRLGEDLSRQAYSEQDQQLVSNVRRAYYSLLQSQSQAQSQRATIRALEDLGRLTQQRLKA